MLSAPCTIPLILYPLNWTADNFCKQFGPSSGLPEHRTWSESKLFDTLVVFLKEFFEKKNDFEKNQQTTKKVQKFSQGTKS